MYGSMLHKCCIALPMIHCRPLPRKWYFERFWRILSSLSTFPLTLFRGTVKGELSKSSKIIKGPSVVFNAREGVENKSDGDARRKTRMKPQGTPMLVWLKLKLTPKGNHSTDITAVFVNFFMHSPKQYLNGQIWWFSVPNILSETKICNLNL